MKNRKAALQQKLDGAIRAYREHVEGQSFLDGDPAAITREGQLKQAMELATNALRTEGAALSAEAMFAPTQIGIDRSPENLGGEYRAGGHTTGGFQSLGEFMRCVHQAGRGAGATLDSRLTIGAAAPGTYGHEGMGADGGYLVPAEYARQIFLHSLEEGSFLPLTNQMPITGNSISFPRDETTPWGSDGIRVYWTGEAGAATLSKPKLGETTLKLRKLVGLVPLTDELLSDAAATGAFVQQKFGASLAWKINDAIVNGVGSAMPLGYRNSGALVTQTKEVGQAADTFTSQNAAKMLGRMSPSSLRSPSLRWLVNSDALNQIMTMTLGNQPIWTPPSAGFQAAPSGYLLGRPIIITQVAQTLGDAGDVQLVDFNQYVTVSKGPDFAQSMHLYFDYGLTAFRLTFRMDGQPWQSAPITPANGANTMSPFIQLEART